MTSPTSPARRSLALTIAATAAALVLTGCGDDPAGSADDPVAEDTTSDSATPTPEPSSAPSPTGATEDGDPAATTTVPVYFVGDGPSGAGGSRGPVLFREFRTVEGDNPLEQAAALMTAGDALDPDYRTLYPGGAFAGIAYQDGTIVVTLPDDGWTTPAAGMSKRDAKLAVQQLVYTVQGVQQERAPVIVQLDGSPTTLFGVDTAGGVKAAPQLDVLNLVSVTAPEEGATVSGSFSAEGVASSFEATVPWQIRQGETVVKKGFTTAEGWFDKLHPWKAKIDVSDLAPGEYTFAAMTDDPSGGTEGFGPSEDTKTIVVE